MAKFLQALSCGKPEYHEVDAGTSSVDEIVDDNVMREIKLSMSGKKQDTLILDTAQSEYWMADLQNIKKKEIISLVQIYNDNDATQTWDIKAVSIGTTFIDLRQYISSSGQKIKTAKVKVSVSK